jgi:hypothetical protein
MPPAPPPNVVFPPFNSFLYTEYEESPNSERTRREAHSLDDVLLQTCITQYACVLYPNLIGWNIGWFTW